MGRLRVRGSWLGQLLETTRRRLHGPPMIGSPLCELAVGTWAGSFSCLDAGGRFLGENTAGERTWGRAPEIEWKTWRQAGSREGRTYNATAMRQIGETWHGLLADVAVLHGEHGCRNLADMFTIGRIATSIPAYLYRRRPQPIRDGALEPQFAALFKVMAGVHAVVEYAARQDEGPHPTDVPQAADLTEYIEREGLFVAASGHVCAGPVNMVREVLDITANGRALIDGQRQLFAARVGDLDALMRYGRACARIDAWTLALQMLLSGKSASRAFDLVDALGASMDGKRLVLVAPSPGGNARRKASASLDGARQALTRELTAAFDALERPLVTKRLDAALATRLGFDPVASLLSLGAVIGTEDLPQPADHSTKTSGTALLPL